MSELELELSAWLPSIKSVLHAGLAEGRSGADLGRTYLRLLFGRDALDELVALLLVSLQEGGEDLTRTSLLASFYSSTADRSTHYTTQHT
jgi:hypothetical protein